MEAQEGKCVVITRIELITDCRGSCQNLSSVCHYSPGINSKSSGDLTGIPEIINSAIWLASL